MIFRLAYIGLKMNSKNLIKKAHTLKTFEDINSTAEKIADDLSLFLKKDIDELNVYSHVFKAGMHRYVARVLNALFKNPKPVAIFPDSIPGFTLIVFKKNPNAPITEGRKEKEKRNPVQEVKQSEAVEGVMEKFFTQTQNKQKVLVIENEDMIFGLFPVADTRQNLKAMDLYITF